ncbi:hypothetical protein [Aureibacter tunicatorum]|uniref:Uncharacterized protein n=1 Tax=Aureibacter tunicatorum TaxID=866807 RepID=A0AAE4BR10_9BACT|nr:hypothetical protein [Aureibacter tunicatorum]MDR6238166.1 hypothetical protein [Aureibacter tunicatorum]BDD03199.1 hypothetical protein AUTU_06820 [Aureibacter tunicatorum]
MVKCFQRLCKSKKNNSLKKNNGIAIASPPFNFDKPIQAIMSRQEFIDQTSEADLAREAQYKSNPFLQELDEMLELLESLSPGGDNNYITAIFNLIGPEWWNDEKKFASQQKKLSELSKKIDMARIMTRSIKAVSEEEEKGGFKDTTKKLLHGDRGGYEHLADHERRYEETAATCLDIKSRKERKMSEFKELKRLETSTTHQKIDDLNLSIERLERVRSRSKKQESELLTLKAKKAEHQKVLDFHSSDLKAENLKEVLTQRIHRRMSILFDMEMTVYRWHSTYKMPQYSHGKGKAPKHALVMLQLLNDIDEEQEALTDMMVRTRCKPWVPFCFSEELSSMAEPQASTPRNTLDDRSFKTDDIVSLWRTIIYHNKKLRFPQLPKDSELDTSERSIVLTTSISSPSELMMTKKLNHFHSKILRTPLGRKLFEFIIDLWQAEEQSQDGTSALLDIIEKLPVTTRPMGRGFEASSVDIGRQIESEHSVMDYLGYTDTPEGLNYTLHPPFLHYLSILAQSVAKLSLGDAGQEFTKFLMDIENQVREELLLPQRGMQELASVEFLKARDYF